MAKVITSVKTKIKIDYKQLHITLNFTRMKKNQMLLIALLFTSFMSITAQENKSKIATLNGGKKLSFTKFIHAVLKTVTEMELEISKGLSPN
jgi:hypothetical protein